MDIDLLLQDIFQEHQLVYAVLSGQDKITIRPVTVKGTLHFQVSEQRGPQIFHQNVSANQCKEYLKKHLALPCKQALLCTKNHDYQILFNKKGHSTILKRAPSRKQEAALTTISSHNRTKNYILPENEPIAFLIALGIMNAEGKVYANKRDKFKQLNRFLEIIADAIGSLNLDKSSKKCLQIIDFGCGKAYLTFALYYYLTEVLHQKVDIIGLDLKTEVITFCQKLASELHYTGLKFLRGDIENYQYSGQKLDMMISLHACDIATDAALEKAIQWGAQVILSVPCCQHELMNQIECQMLKPILSHGILKERFSALVTDAARAQLLEILGYKTDVIEFIDLEHTPKNLLIRAIKQDARCSKKALKEYLEFKRNLKITPSLEVRFEKALKSLNS